MSLHFNKYCEEEHILISDVVSKDHYPIKIIKCTRCDCTLETKSKEWNKRLWFNKQHKNCKGTIR